MIRIKGLLLLGVVMICGCARFQNSAPPVAAGTAPAPTALSPADERKLDERNNAVSLMYDLFQDEKNLDKILIIKHGSPEFDGLIKAIALTTHDSGTRLEQMAAADPALRLHALELPAGEKATRAAIAKTEQHELLFSSGNNFQFQLLLTQVDALSYGWHLAMIAAENSTQPADVRAFNEVSVALANLHEQVVTMLKGEARKVP
jgi:hypothetical protein